MTKRGKLEIIRDILKIVKENRDSIKMTPLMRKSNVSSARFKEYSNELLEKKFVRIADNGKEKSVLITERGIKYLERYQTIINFIDEFEL